MSVYFPALLDINGHVKGTTYMLPFWQYAMGLLYRKDVVDDPAFQAAYKEKFARDWRLPETLEEYAELAKWAVERIADGRLIGFVGLTVPRRALPFTPCVEVGYRLAKEYWGQGFATEAAREALRHGFETLRLSEVVSFTAKLNLPSQAVMKRLGLVDAREDFEHPALPEGSPLRPHCLYRLSRQRWLADRA